MISHVLVNFAFTLFKKSIKTYLLKYKNHVIKDMLHRGFEFLKKNFICEEKFGIVTKVKLVAKIKKHNQLYFETFVLPLSGDNA